MKSYYDTPDLAIFVELFQQLEAADSVATAKNLVATWQSAWQQQHKRMLSRDVIIKAYREWTAADSKTQQIVLQALRLKPVRTASGVTPVTVLTKPFPCPGKCIFCPNDIRMPKSYIHDEPGAQRAERNYFDPYLQTYNRLQALHNIGHPVEKVELIVLGGTWSFYPPAYQRWFIAECFRAMNEFGVVDGRAAREQEYRDIEAKRQAAQGWSATNDPTHNREVLAQHQIQGTHLAKRYNQVVSELYTAPEKKLGLDLFQQASWESVLTAQKINETATVRCVGLVLETRPDNISEEEVISLRKLGATKTQIGVQSLSDDVLTANNRGHDVAATRKAFALLRQAGFKIHAHWMANLYGSSPEQDMLDFEKLFSDPDFCPDELKIYPCSLIDSAELMQYYQDGRWRPYTFDELRMVVKHCLQKAPAYCRLTRVIRDIPSTDIVVGNHVTNLRQVIENELVQEGISLQEIRSREVRHRTIAPSKLTLAEVPYETSSSHEVFLQWIEPETNVIAAFLRLSLPKKPSFISELQASAIIREVHVYGQSVALSEGESSKAQHRGLGKQLIEHAVALAHKAGFAKISVISAIGTREYYRQRGFSDGELYQHRQCATL